MKVGVSLPSDKAQNFEGLVRFLDNAVEPGYRHHPDESRVTEYGRKTHTSQFLNVSLILDTLTNAVTVPNEAVQQGAEGNFIIVAKDDNSVEIRPVETAASEYGVTAIGKGLKAGETVVTDGHLRLTANSKVRIKDAPENCKNRQIREEKHRYSS